jgi:hypothetical protein
MSAQHTETSHASVSLVSYSSTFSQNTGFSNAIISVHPSTITTQQQQQHTAPSRVECKTGRNPTNNKNWHNQQWPVFAD